MIALTPVINTEQMSQVNYCKMINSWNARFSRGFWNMQAIIYQCFFSLNDCTFDGHLSEASVIPNILNWQDCKIFALTEHLRTTASADSPVKYWCNDGCYEFYDISIIAALYIYIVTMSYQLSFPRKINRLIHLFLAAT